MPIFEYEAVESGCPHCANGFEFLHGADDAPLTRCPGCGAPVRRLVSRVGFSVGGDSSPDKAAKKGFSTYRRSGKGVYEKVAGEDGPSGFAAPIEQAAKPAKKVYNLDE